MSDLIDRENAVALIEAKQKELCPLGKWSRHAVYGADREKFDAWQEIIDELDAIPTVDAVPVVRCKDCKHCRNGCQCDVPLGVSEMEKYILVDEDDFCSYGERKETD